jgi:hypothetical protein
MDRAEMLWKEVVRLTELLKQKDEEIQKLKQESSNAAKPSGVGVISHSGISR